jgi:hypothetical protein
MLGGASGLDLHLRELRQQPLPMVDTILPTDEVAQDLPTVRRE